MDFSIKSRHERYKVRDDVERVWTRASLGVRLLRKPPIYRLVVLIHPFLHKNNQPQKRLEYLVIYLTLFGVIFLLSQK